MSDEQLVPMTEKELEREISIQCKAMAARKDVGWVRIPEFFAATLAKRLMRSRVYPMRNAAPPPIPPASSYPGHSTYDSDKPNR